MALAFWLFVSAVASITMKKPGKIPLLALIMMPRQADTVEVGKPFTIDGSASKDADGDELQYRWTLSGLGSPIDLSKKVSDTVIIDAQGRI